MAIAHLTTSSSFLFLLLTATIRAATEPNADDGYSQLLSPAKLRLRKEKLSHLHFYYHDILSRPSPTAVPIVRPTTNSSTFFGLVNMFDDLLTVGLEPSSKIVGRAQGFYGFASHSEFAALTAQNFVFVEGKFNGSTLTVMGRNAVLSPVKELPVIGGTGAFRFARGYAEARTRVSDLTNGDAVVEYNIYVYHY
ncbi:unnamed protein product [Linum tenue]|uniref:Dirigent protein n=1 Tax=Linum tenue TaxID=586396 RepID=A0AAV0J9G4_9ROSI|nr:unnamed protein product [Linum tenue]